MLPRRTCASYPHASSSPNPLSPNRKQSAGLLRRILRHVFSWGLRAALPTRKATVLAAAAKAPSCAKVSPAPLRPPMAKSPANLATPGAFPNRSCSHELDRAANMGPMPTCDPTSLSSCKGKGILSTCAHASKGYPPCAHDRTGPISNCGALLLQESASLSGAPPRRQRRNALRVGSRSCATLPACGSARFRVKLPDLGIAVQSDRLHGASRTEARTHGPTGRAPPPAAGSAHKVTVMAMQRMKIWKRTVYGRL